MRACGRRENLAGPLRWAQNYTTAYEEFPGLKSAVRVQECISVLGDNPVAKRLGNFALSSLNPVFEGQSHANKKRLQEESVIDVGEGSAGGGKGMTFAPLKVSWAILLCVCGRESVPVSVVFVWWPTLWWPNLTGQRGPLPLLGLGQEGFVVLLPPRAARLLVLCRW